MVGSKIGIFPPTKLFYDTDSVFLRGQIWRLLTGPFYTGPIDRNNILNTLFDFTFFRSIELSQFPRRKSQFVFVLMLIAIVGMTICSFYIPYYVGFAIHPALIYLFSKLKPDQMFSLIFFNVPARYVPIVDIVLGFVLNGSISIQIIGCLTGHIVYYFLYVLPLVTKTAIFQVPPILSRYLD